MANILFPEQLSYLESFSKDKDELIDKDEYSDDFNSSDSSDLSDLSDSSNEIIEYNTTETIIEKNKQTTQPKIDFMFTEDIINKKSDNK